MAVEVFGNVAMVTVISGGTDAPASGTQETWTVSSAGNFPAVSSSATPPTQCHIADISLNSEIILVTNMSGTTWTVTRGAESTTPVAHSADFIVYQVVTAAVYAGFQSAYDTAPDWLNVVTKFGADPTGTNDSTTAISNALSALPSGGGTVYFPAGTYKVSGALSVPTGAALQGAGEDITIISQTSTSADTLSATDQRYITIRTSSSPGHPPAPAAESRSSTRPRQSPGST